MRVRPLTLTRREALSLAPPEPSTSEPTVTGCVGEVRGAALYVGISSRTGRPTFDRLPPVAHFGQRVAGGTPVSFAQVFDEVPR